MAEWQPVRSSTFSHAKYDKSTMYLRLSESGQLLRYTLVPTNIYKRFLMPLVPKEHFYQIYLKNRYGETPINPSFGMV